jgi:hypothetical protein
VTQTTSGYAPSADDSPRRMVPQRPLKDALTWRITTLRDRHADV